MHIKSATLIKRFYKLPALTLEKRKKSIGKELKNIVTIISKRKTNILKHLTKNKKISLCVRYWAIIFENKDLFSGGCIVQYGTVPGTGIFL